MGKKHLLKILSFWVTTCLIGGNLFALAIPQPAKAAQEELAIEVLNKESRPIVGGYWQVGFNTQGWADLTITGLDNTWFVPTANGEQSNIEFISLKCGSQIFSPEREGNSYFIGSWHCQETSYFLVKVLEVGKHHLQFNFGGQIADAFNSAGDYKWGKRLGGTNGDNGNSVATDNNNNIIVVGSIAGDADLNANDTIDSGLPETASATYGTTNDIFVAVFNSAGTYQWAKRLGGTSHDYGYGVTTDSSDNIIIVGHIEGDADLNGNDTIDSGLPETASARFARGDGFVAVFNSAGTYQWAKRLGGASVTLDDKALSVAVDTSNNVIVAGQIYGNADLNGNDTIDSGLPETASAIYGSLDIFVAVFNSAGTYQWAKRLGGMSNDSAYSVAADTNNNIVVTGVVYFNADLNGNGTIDSGLPETASLTFAASNDIFVAAFNSAGTYQWAKRLGGEGGGDGDIGRGVAIDSDNNVIVTGQIYGNADLNGNDTIDSGLPETASATYGSIDAFIIAFSSAGTYQWAKRLGGTSVDAGYGIAIDIDNNIIVTGSIGGNADLDANDSISGTLPETGSGGRFIVSFASSTYQWAKRLGGTGYSIVLDSGNSILTSGNTVTGNNDFNGDGVIDSGLPETTTARYGSSDVLVSKFSGGSATNIVSPTSTNAGSTGNTFNFTYTNNSIDRSSGDMAIAVPAGWSTPQTSSASTAGYVTATSTGAAVIGTAENTMDASSTWATTNHVVLSIDTSDKQAGAASMVSTLASQATYNDIWYYNYGSASDWGTTNSTNAAKVGVWAKISGGSIGWLYFEDDDTASLASPLDSASVSLGTSWTYSTVSLAAARSSVASYGFRIQNADPAAVTLRVDSISSIFDAADVTTNWTADSNITVSAGVAKEGTSSIKCAYAAAAGTGTSGECYRTANSPAVSFGPGTTVSFWVSSTVALDAGDFAWLDDGSASVGSPEDAVSLPAIPANTWTYVTLTAANSAGKSCKSYGLRQVVDKGAMNIAIDAMGKEIDAMSSLTNWTSPTQYAQNISEEATIKKEGSYSLRNTLSTAIASGDKWYTNLGASENWSGYTKVGLWIYASSTINAGYLQFQYDDTASLASPIASLNIATTTAGTWSWQVLDLTGSRSSINSYGFNVTNGVGANTTVYIDYVMLGPGVPTISGQTITTRFLSMTSTQAVVVSYGSGGGAGGVTASSTVGVHTFTTQDRSSVAGTLAEIDSSPTITVNNPTVSASFSLGIWLRPTNSFATKAIAVKDSEIRLVTNSSGQPICQIHNGTSWQAGATSSVALTLNNWQYVACIYDRSNIKIYINGVQTATTSMANVDLYDTSNALNLGYDSSGGYGYFQGGIDEFKYYKYARTASQIQSDYLGPATKKGAGIRSVSVGEQDDQSDGLVAYWKLDEASWNGTNGEVKDSSGNGNNGTSTGGATRANTTSTAKFGRAGVFDGADDFVDVADVMPTTEITIESWVMPKGTQDGEYGGTYGNQANSHRILVKESDKSLLGQFLIGGSTKSPTAPAGSVPLNVFTHIALTYNGSEVVFWVNGVKQTPVPASGSLTYNGTDIVIGKGQASTYRFSGIIDDVRVYNKARSAEQIRRDYDSGPHPVAYWRLDEKTGQYAYDSSGNNLYGTLGANDSSGSDDPKWKSGKYGAALKFDGEDDYVNVADNDLLSLGNSTADQKMTIEAWVKADDITNCRIVAKKTNASDGEYAFMINNSDYMNFVLYDGASGSINMNSSAALTSYEKKWVHLAGVYDGSAVNTGINLYINGVLSTGSGGSAGSYAAMENLTAPVQIGKDPDQKCNGLIDDVRIYNYARTQRQIMEDINVGHPAVGSPVGSYAAYWPLDEGNGSTTYDKSQSQANGTLTGGVLWSNLGKKNKALDFDGVNDYVSFSSLTAYNSSSSHSYSAWVRPDAIDGTNGYRWILNNSSANQGTSLILSSGKIGFFYAGGGAVETSSSTLAVGQWYHVVAVYDGNGNVDFYLNGRFDGRNQTKSLYRSWTATNSNPRLGEWTNGSYPFDGLIDEVKIYPFALSAAEVELEYNQGASLKLGSTGTENDGITPSNSASSTYCVPGDTSYCAPPIGHWKMDTKQGSTIYDVSGGGNNGDLKLGSSPATSSAWQSAAKCHSGSCLKFDGTDDYVDLNDSSLTSVLKPNLPLTLSAWIKLDATSDGGIISNNYKQNYYSGAWLQLYSGSLFCAFGSDGETGSGARQSKTGTTALATGVWYNVTCVIRGASDMSIYINGVDDGGTYGGAGGDMAYTNDSGRIGIIDNNVGDGNEVYLNGKIDDVRIYNYARSQAQIAWDYNRGAPVAWWKMNDGQNSSTTCNATTSVAVDSSGKGNSGTLHLLTATSTAWDIGKYGCAINLNGSNDYITVPDSDAFSFTNGSGNDKPFSLSAWVKLDDVLYETILGKWIGSASNREWVFYTANDSKIHLELYHADTGTIYIGRKYNTALTSYVGQWMHLVATYDGSEASSGVKIYLNGVRVDDTNASAGTYTGMSNTTTNLEIGSYGAGTSGLLDGLIDDVRIYSYDLTPAQIKMAYNEGAAVRFGPSEGLP